MATLDWKKISRRKRPAYYRGTRPASEKRFGNDFGMSMRVFERSDGTFSVNACSGFDRPVGWRFDDRGFATPEEAMKFCDEIADTEAIVTTMSRAMRLSVDATIRRSRAS